MGNLIWHEYARYVALTASVYSIWASFWGIFYRKYLFDFVGGIVRSPGGVQPPNSASIIVFAIVKVPIVQLLTIFTAFTIIAIDYPLPYLKNTAIHRSFPIRIVLLLAQTALAILFYQGVNGAAYSLIAALCYTRAQLLGEVMKEAKDNRGRGGKA